VNCFTMSRRNTVIAGAHGFTDLRLTVFAGYAPASKSSAGM